MTKKEQLMKAQSAVEQAHVENFLDIIANAITMRKRDTSFKADGVNLPSYEYRFKAADYNEYVVDSEILWVDELDEDDRLQPYFKLSEEDHKKVLAACKRRYEILQERIKMRKLVKTKSK